MGTGVQDGKSNEKQAEGWMGWWPTSVCVCVRQGLLISLRAEW